MRIEYQHRYTQEEAKKKVSNLISDLKQQYGDKIKNDSYNWINENIMEFQIQIKTGIPFVNPRINGKIEVSDNLLVLEGDLPLIAESHKSEIRSMITKTLENIL